MIGARGVGDLPSAPGNWPRGTVSQNITKESFEQFKQRAVNTMYSIRIETINNLIGSMNARLNDVIRTKGNRTRY